MPPLARIVSILGHPLVALPLAALLLATHEGAQRAWPLALGFGAVAIVVMGYSTWQVRRRRWAHVDASQRHERGALNRFLLALFAFGALVAWRSQAPELALGLGLSAALIVVALLAARWCKLSLHVAFATFAACLLWRIGPWAMLAGFAFAALVAWSRLALARHAPRDLVAGACAGLAAGAVFVATAAR